MTGASSGIGAACALRLDALGAQVFAGVRNAPDAEALRDRASSRLQPLRLDVTDDDSIAAAAAAVSRAVGDAGLAGLVNNAGVGSFGPLEFIPIGALRALLDVNVSGQVATIQAFLPLLRRARGRIVNVGSVSGVVAPPFLGAYSASKFALEALSDALRRELASSGIRVSLIEAGRIATPIWSKALRDFDALRGALPREAEQLYGAALDVLRSGAARGGGLPPEAVAEAVEHALVAPRPRTRYVVGSDARARRRLRWLPDRIQDRLLRRRLPRSA